MSLFARFAAARQEVLRENGNVVAAVSERRNEERHDRDPVIQVVTEAAVLDGLTEIFIRRRDDADVHFRRMFGADFAHFPFLHGAKELHLHGERHLPDLIQKQRPAMGALK